MSIEAMKQALQALEFFCEYGVIDRPFERIAELKQAIAEAEDAVDREREACAKLCEELGIATNGMHERNHECAQAIRARGEK